MRDSLELPGSELNLVPSSSETGAIDEAEIISKIRENPQDLVELLEQVPAESKASLVRRALTEGQIIALCNKRVQPLEMYSKQNSFYYLLMQLPAIDVASFGPFLETAAFYDFLEQVFPLGKKEEIEVLLRAVGFDEIYRLLTTSQYPMLFLMRLRQLPHQFISDFLSAQSIDKIQHLGPRIASQALENLMENNNPVFIIEQGLSSRLENFLLLKVNALIDDGFFPPFQVEQSTSGFFKKSMPETKKLEEVEYLFQHLPLTYLLGFITVCGEALQKRTQGVPKDFIKLCLRGLWLELHLLSSLDKVMNEKFSMFEQQVVFLQLTHLLDRYDNPARALTITKDKFGNAIFLKAQTLVEDDLSAVLTKILNHYKKEGQQLFSRHNEENVTKADEILAFVAKNPSLSAFEYLTALTFYKFQLKTTNCRLFRRLTLLEGYLTEKIWPRAPQTELSLSDTQNLIGPSSSMSVVNTAQELSQKHSP